MNAVEIAGVAHAYGRRAVLRGVSLCLAPGEILSLAGPSGCGKSTLLRLVAGLEPVSEGEIALDGTVVAAAGWHVPPERRGVGMVFQDFALFPHLSVAGNVAFGLGGPRAARRQAALAMLDRVGLAGRAEERPHALSGGQQQRVALARALAPAPRVVLLDEPFSSLDVGLRGRLRADTRRLLAATGAAAIIVTHDPEEAMFMADRLALMADGRIVQWGAPADLYRRPASPFVAAFFGPVNRLAGRVADGRVATPLGDVPAPGLADGTLAEVIVRAEALRPGGAGPSAGPLLRVRSVRAVGADALLDLAVAGGVALEARCPAATAPAPGEEVRVTADPAGVFVFAAATGQ